jgi:hypothetical protein
VPTQTRQTGVEVVGLDESIRAIRKFDKKAGAEAVAIFREEAAAVQASARARAAAHPAAPSARGWIGRSATSKGAGVKLIARRGRAHATEWGMHRHELWGRGFLQRLMQRRTFRPWSGNAFKVTGGGGPGYVIQPAIRDHLPGMAPRVAGKLTLLLRKLLDAEGVPRG